MSTAVAELNERAAAAGMDDVAGLATDPRALRRWIRGDIDLLFTSPELGVDRRRILLTWASRRARPPPQRVVPQCYLYPTPHRRVLPLCYIRHPTYTYASPGGASFGSSPSTRRTSWSSHRLAGHSPSARATWGCSHARWIRRLCWRRATHAAPRPQHHPLNFRPHLGSSPRPPTSAPTGGSAVPTGNPPPRPSPPSLTLPQARPHRGLPAEGAQRVQRHAHV